MTATAASAPVSSGNYQRQGPVNLARRLSQVLLSAVSEALPPQSLRNGFGTLVAIANLPGLEQKKIATALALDATSVGQIIDHLESRGFVRRVGSPIRRVIKAQADALSVLTSQECKTLVDLMTRVIEANPQHDRPGAVRRPPKPKSG